MSPKPNLQIVTDEAVIAKPLDVEDLVEQIVTIDAQTERLMGERETLVGHLKEALPENGTYPIAGVKVTISQAKRFNTKAFTETYPADKLPTVYTQPEPQLDAAKAKAYLKVMDLDGDPQFFDLGARSLRIS